MKLIALLFIMIACLNNQVLFVLVLLALNIISIKEINIYHYMKKIKPI